MLSTITSQFSPLLILAGILSQSIISTAHTVITYPGWRGDNLISNGTLYDLQVKPGSLGMNWDDKTDTYTFPYGMQWMYPCGGMRTTTNRTKWPINGGAVAVQPGWNAGHATAFFYINLGIGTEPQNMSHPMVPVFQITGPSTSEYPGTFCLPQVPTPANLTFNVGDNATIQVVETAVHGAALYSCVDITFAEPADVAPVTPDNCFNTTDQSSKIGFNLVFTAADLKSAASRLHVAGSTLLLTYLPYLAMGAVAIFWL